MMQPRKYKYKKIHKPLVNNNRVDYKNIYPVVGNYGLKSLSSGRLTVTELECVKKLLQKKLKKYGKVFINVFPHYQITAKPQEVRMGKGKGDIKSWVCLVKKGVVIFEVNIRGVMDNNIKEIFRLAGERISLKTKFIKSIE